MISNPNMLMAARSHTSSSTRTASSKTKLSISRVGQTRKVMSDQQCKDIMVAAVTSPTRPVEKFTNLRTLMNGTVQVPAQATRSLLFATTMDAGLLRIAGMQ